MSELLDQWIERQASREHVDLIEALLSLLSETLDALDQSIDCDSHGVEECHCYSRRDVDGLRYGTHGSRPSPGFARLSQQAEDLIRALELGR